MAADGRACKPSSSTLSWPFAGPILSAQARRAAAYLILLEGDESSGAVLFTDDTSPDSRFVGAEVSVSATVEHDRPLDWLYTLLSYYPDMYRASVNRAGFFRASRICRRVFVAKVGMAFGSFEFISRIHGRTLRS